MELEVGPDDAEVRLDAFLRARHRLPRSLVYKLIRQARIVVGGRKVTAERRLEAGERVTVPDEVVRAAPPPADAPPLPARAALGGAEAARVRAAIAYEDDDVIVFDKPAGIAAHAGTGHEEGGVVELLRRWLRVPLDAPFQPSLANRLDRDTSGLVLLAKTPYGQRRLGKAVKGARVEKEYVALVGGGVPPASGEIRAALKKACVREPSGGSDPSRTVGLEKMVVSTDPDALAATTRYRVLRPVARAEGALVALEPVTGRTHQLRAHCAAIGHPIALDWKYGDAGWNRRLGAGAGLTRLFLHARRLAFPHVRRVGEVVRVESDLPPDLAGPLARLAD